MSKEISLGISRGTFMVGVVVAILASSALSTGVAMTVIQQGPQGPKGARVPYRALKKKERDFLYV